MNYEKLTKEQIIRIHKDTLEYLNEQEQEIERLKIDYQQANEILAEQSEEIERLNNDIKELLKENSNKEKAIVKQDNIINNPEDLTLCKMWADTKLQEKMKN